MQGEAQIPFHPSNAATIGLTSQAECIHDIASSVLLMIKCS